MCAFKSARSRLTTLFALVALPWTVGVAAAAAQLPDATGLAAASAEVASIRARSFGVALDAEGLVGGGADYKVRFHPGGFTFTPALGRQVRTNHTLGFTFESVTLGDSELHHTADLAAPERALNRVLYRHGSSIVERYDVRADGIHQSFVFHDLPAGSGELVVRGRLRSDFPAVTSAGEGLRFGLPGVGGVSYGAVTGIDAAGHTASGSLRVDGEHLELVLPAEFVATAKLPLVLDPIVGPVFTVTPQVFIDGAPDIAFTQTSQRYLAVWQRTFSIFDSDIRGQLLTPGGILVGGLLMIESTSGSDSRNPAVATVSSSDRFAVTWQQKLGVFVLDPFRVILRAVSADGVLSSTIGVVGATTTSQINSDVGGERTSADDDVVVVWEEVGVGIRGRQVNVPPTGDPSAFGTTVLIESVSVTTNPTTPAISKSAGGAGRFLVTWRRSGSGTVNPIRARVTTRDLALLGSGPTDVSSIGTGLSNNFRPDCDGDGTNFVVAWDQEESMGAGVSDIVCRNLSFLNGNVVLGVPNEIENDPNDDERAPSVAFAGATYVVAYEDEDPNGFNTYVKSIDPFQCTICEDEEVLEASVFVNRNVAVGSRYSGGATAPPALEEVVILWESLDPGTGASAIRGIRYDSPVSSVNLGGACLGTNAPGTCLTPCPLNGNANFRPQLQAAAPSVFAVLVIGFNELAVSCGTCTIWPDLGSQVILNLTATDPNGSASFNAPIPPGAAGTFVAQWAIFSGSSCPLIGGFTLSNGRRFTIF